MIIECSIPYTIGINFERFAHRIAVNYNDKSITYGELGGTVEAISQALRSNGVARGALVGLHVDRSPLMIASLLAIHATGAAYVPLDPSLPHSRLKLISEDADLDCLIHGGDRAEVVRACKRLDLSRLKAGEWGGTAASSVAAVSAGDLAYVIYTSGSTGRPKGVKVHHGAVVNFLESMAVEPGMTKEDALLAVTTPAFDISVLELLLPLLVGARIVLASSREVIDGRALANLLDSHGVTIMQATPVTWRMMLAAGWEGRRKLKALCGGEALDGALASKLLPRVDALWNMYGPTETTVWSACGLIRDGSVIDVGHPIRNTSLHVLDDQGAPVPSGEVGELYIGGDGVALGYTDEALTRARFVPDAFSTKPGARLYRTGDLARSRDGRGLEILGRSDDQVKVKGHRIELAEVDGALRAVPFVENGAVFCRKDAMGENELVAAVVFARDGDGEGEEDRIVSLRHALEASLPGYMVPSSFLAIDEMPLTPNQKVDRRALETLAIPEVKSAPGPAAEADPRDALRQILCQTLGLDRIDTAANLFDLGLTSLQANVVISRFVDETGLNASVGDLFENPSVAAFMASLDPGSGKESRRRLSDVRISRSRGPWGSEAVAIIGMAVRVPGADDLDAFWDVLAEGRETITRFTADEDDASVEPELTGSPNYVRARGMITNPEMFDAAFFGLRPNEAAVMDPQQRVFLELAYLAFEDAGYDPERAGGLVGSYAGMGNNFYYYYNVSTQPQLVQMVGEVQVEVGREKDHIATLVSHKLDLRGPSVSVHTACSTGLIAIDAACYSLLSCQCDMAVAGAIELRTPQMSGQPHEPGGIFTADGHCRPFSADASGTMFSDGAGVVVLKRLSDAVQDGDRIHAVIRGTAVNHDGSNKKSYLAPSVSGQMDVIRKAQERAGVEPHTVSMIEAHGTATPVGDPIEFTALRRIFEAGKAGEAGAKNGCALSSVKGNLGHPTTAAGIVGVIKTALCLEKKTIVPQVNFSRINPSIDIDNSPFFIPTEAGAWSVDHGPRRAGISSFGFCGTNGHVVLEEAPEPIERPEVTPRPVEVLPLSAATEASLQWRAQDIGPFLQGADPVTVSNAAYTFAVGRKRSRYRSFLTVNAQTGALGPENVPKRADGELSPVVFAFPGQGAQYAGMGRGLYETEPVFREALDTCASILHAHLGEDIRPLMFDDGHAERLTHTSVLQPAIFCIEYALSRLWKHFGVQPTMLVGHSIGEFACAVLAGVMSLDDAIMLIAERGRLMGELPSGDMLSVRLGKDELATRLMPGLSIAVANSDSLSVAAGPKEAVDELAGILGAEGVQFRRLHTSHAFHSTMMAPAVGPFLEKVRTVELSAPELPIISTVTGQELSAAEAVDPNYWADHIVNTVRFDKALQYLRGLDRLIMLEVGPRTTLTTLGARAFVAQKSHFALSSLADSADNLAENQALARAIGQFWSLGGELDWERYFEGRANERVALPSYRFERKRHWIEPAHIPRIPKEEVAADLAANEGRRRDVISSAQQTGDVSSDVGVIEAMKAILQEVSGEDMSEAPVDASFFELGLDSLLLTPLTFLVKERFGVDVSFRQISGELSTLQALAACLQASTSEHETAAAVSDVGGERGVSEIPLTVSQAAVLQHLRDDPAANAMYVEAASITLDGRIDAPALTRAVETVFRRHPNLCTSISPGGDSLTVSSEAAIAVRCMDAGAAGLEEIEALEAATPVDPEGGVPFRVTLVRFAEEAHALIIAVHTLVCDGWSLDLLIEELGKAYSALVEGRDLVLSPPGDPVAFVAAEREYLSRQATQDLIGTTASFLGSDGGNAAPAQLRPCASDTARLLVGEAGVEVHSALKRQATALNCSVFTLLLDAFAQSALVALDVRQAVIGIPSAGQSTRNAPTLVGQCVNVLPVRVESALPDADGNSVLSLRDALLEAADRREVPFRSIQQAIGAPPCQLVFQHTKRLKPEDFRFSGLRADYRLLRRNSQAFNLLLDVTEYEDRFEFALIYKTDAISKNLARDILNCFVSRLERAERHDDLSENFKMQSGEIIRAPEFLEN